MPPVEVPGPGILESTLQNPDSTSQDLRTWYLFVLPWGLIKTNDIWANCELIDSLDGAVLWQTDFAQATDWQYPANQVIAGFTEKLAKKFPYRG